MPGEERPIRTEEVEVIRAALEQALVREVMTDTRETVSTLTVVAHCECGCASVDFEPQLPEEVPKPIADGVGVTPRGGDVGVIVWGQRSGITGLEVYDLGAGESDLVLPVPDTISPWDPVGNPDHLLDSEA